MNDLGFHHLLNMLQRRDRDRAPLFLAANDRMRPAGDMGYINPHRRPNRANGENPTVGLELLYGDGANNPNLPGDAVMNANPGEARSRHGRAAEDQLLLRDPFTAFWQDTAMLRERVEDRAARLGNKDKSQRAQRLQSNPWEVLR